MQVKTLPELSPSQRKKSIFMFWASNRDCDNTILYRAVSMKPPPLLHRDKNSRNYVTKISFLWNTQEFSSASFPYVFKAIGLLENILETKNQFFCPFKKVTFSVSRILNAKTKKSDVFLTHFLNIDFIWGKSRFLKIDFLPFVSSVKIHVF